MDIVLNKHQNSLFVIFTNGFLRMIKKEKSLKIMMEF